MFRIITLIWLKYKFYIQQLFSKLFLYLEGGDFEGVLSTCVIVCVQFFYLVL